MTHKPSSQVFIPKSVLKFAQEASVYKTPCIRTRGAGEAANQPRGEPDWIDTVATLMLWRELVIAGMPVTYMLTANGGDETDLRVQVKGDPHFIDINVKGTKANVPKTTEPAAYGNLAIKCEELGLALIKNGHGYLPHPIQVNIELRENRSWAVADKAERLADIYIKIFVHTEPLSAEHQQNEKMHVHFTNWLPVSGGDFAAQLLKLNSEIAAGNPPVIPGINHPGMWIVSTKCRPYEQLFEYLESQLQNHGAPDFVLRWKRIDKACIRHNMKIGAGVNISTGWLSFDLASSSVRCEFPENQRAQFNACLERKENVIEILRERFNDRVIFVCCGADHFGSHSL